jgi:hypothetical protein
MTILSGLSMSGDEWCSLDTEQEKFSVLAGITLNKYMNIEENERHMD